MDVLTGPSGGYLLGFFLAAITTSVSRAQDEGRGGVAFTMGRDALSGIAAHVVILGLGVVGLTFTTAHSPSSAVAVGAQPFVVGGILKSLGAAALAVALRPRVRTLTGLSTGDVAEDQSSAPTSRD